MNSGLLSPTPSFYVICVLSQPGRILSAEFINRINDFFKRMK